MRKIATVFIVVFFSFFVTSLEMYAQKRMISYVDFGKCKEVLFSIQKQVQNDSLAVEYFKDNYKVPDLKNQNIFKKNSTEVIKFFNLREDLVCYFRHRVDNVLLDNR